jgi:diadenylate cyclase
MIGWLFGVVGDDPLRIALDILDVLLVATLFYRVLLLLRGTRAMQMIFGIVVLVLVYQVSRRFGLITLFTILDRVLASAVLLVVVLFQNEIRRALMRVGSQPLFRRARREREAEVVEEVVRAASALAARRVGALIVFERSASLDDFIEHGTPLDASVSRELLYAIFVPALENPMHDGAVVLREGRIHEAGAFLPLTENPEVDRVLGTRHRAAIGITEETDAVVVVVSEERGKISVCFDGNIVRNVAGANLRSTLLGLLDRPGRVKKPTDERVTRAPDPRPTEARVLSEAPEPVEEDEGDAEHEDDAEEVRGPRVTVTTLRPGPGERAP